MLRDARGFSGHRRLWMPEFAKGMSCLTVVSQHGAGNFFLQEVEDFVNVSFFVKFLLLFWLHGAD